MKIYTKLGKPVLALLIVTIICLTSGWIYAQQQTQSSSDILQSMKKLNVLGSVLYIAAHPDDENTGVLAYFSKGQLMQAAYMSLTRGDGGQNLLGDEQGALLGVIRTQELLAARRLDGAQQFFSRAIDFGYSKSAEETLELWNREDVLYDIVKVIRQFQPDVILTRFTSTQGGHGHHLASAMLAEEALHAAADPNKFPDQLKTLSPWQAKRILWNAWRSDDNSLPTEVGGYNQVLGVSYSEIAAAGRSMHKSQGFGVSASRSSRIERFELIAGEPAQTDLFDGIDIGWRRVPKSGKVQKLITNAINNFKPDDPAASVPGLIKIYQELNTLESGHWVNIKKREVKNLIYQCSGLWLEAVVWQPSICPGMDVDVRLMAVNRTPTRIQLQKVDVTYAASDSTLNADLVALSPVSLTQKVTIPNDAKYTQPFWLIVPAQGDMFTVTDFNNIGKAENGPALTATFHLKIDDVPIALEIPVVYRWTDAVGGEQFKPFVIRPPVSVAIDHPTYVFSDSKVHDVEINVSAGTDDVAGELFVTLPDGWHAEPASIPFSLAKSGEQTGFRFKVSNSPTAVSGVMQLHARINSHEYSDHEIDIEYPHIKPQMVLVPAQTKLVKLDIQTTDRRIGYIMGSGDEIPDALMQLGYSVDLLSDEDINSGDLSKYDVIICGVRAFNARENLENQQQRLIDFVEQGGTWIVQHNTRFGNKVSQIGPYPLTIGRDRIAKENAPMEILIPDHPLMSYPNKITEKDFEGWVQERGLYFASEWGGKLYPILSGSDQGEPAQLGGLLYAPYGKGIFIYTGFSWFRQLPAGVPGAYRIFVNLVSAKGKQ
ncbi:PIG-L family deacetylase [candidate division KSB1 bacterium]|nr:PIG-L family deacetylase [candidate division KSB1 bacterium]